MQKIILCCNFENEIILSLNIRLLCTTWKLTEIFSINDNLNENVHTPPCNMAMIIPYLPSFSVARPSQIIPAAKITAINTNNFISTISNTKCPRQNRSEGQFHKNIWLKFMKQKRIVINQFWILNIESVQQPKKSLKSILDTCVIHIACHSFKYIFSRL